ncbi:MAG: hypothetical protein IPJ82_16010 [Lewinellaceae bacterium]|nr:hypothetical protein [Lewinellaceae bacterium]
MLTALPVMKKFLFPFFLLLSALAHAQMWNGTDTLYGNEWIQFSQPYFKIKIAEDGVYRLSYQALVTAGIPVSDIPASQFKLYRYGVEEPVFASTDGAFGDQDFLEFYGEKNRDAVDQFLFGNAGAENINPWYSLFNDTTVYFLTWGGAGLRYADIQNDLNNLPPKTEYCWWTSQQIYNQSFVKRHRSDEITFSWFEGDGFCRAPSNSTSVSLNTKKLYTAGPPAVARVRYACQEGQHKQQVSVNDTLFAEDNFTNWKIVERTFSVPLSLVQNGATVKVQSTIGGQDRQSVAGARSGTHGNLILKMRELPGLRWMPQRSFNTLKSSHL